MPPEERFSSDIKVKKKASALFLIHILFIIVLFGTDKKSEYLFFITFVRALAKHRIFCSHNSQDFHLRPILLVIFHFLSWYNG
jgi:hypothetical protein